MAGVLVRQLLPVKNVKDYGATGDGNTDDTDGIAAGIAAAAGASGGIVYIPPGIYITEPVTLPPGVVLQGVNGQGYYNATTTVPNANTRSVLKLKAGSTGPLLSPDDSGANLATHVKIRDLALDANAIAQSAINLADRETSIGRFWTIEGCYIVNSGHSGSGYAVYVGNLNTAVTMRDCIIFNGTSGSRGGYNGIGWYGQDGRMDNCYVGYFANVGIYLLGGDSDQTFTMSGGASFGSVTGLVVAGTGPVLEGASFDHNQNDGIYAAYDFSIIGCVFHTNSIQTTNTWSNVMIATGHGAEVAAIACRGAAESGEAGGKVAKYFFNVGAGCTLNDYACTVGASNLGTGYSNE